MTVAPATGLNSVMAACRAAAPSCSDCPPGSVQHPGRPASSPQPTSLLRFLMVVEPSSRTKG